MPPDSLKPWRKRQSFPYPWGTRSGTPSVDSTKPCTYSRSSNRVVLFSVIFATWMRKILFPRGGHHLCGGCTFSPHISKTCLRGGLVRLDYSCPSRCTLRWRAICPGGLLLCTLSCHDRLRAMGSKRNHDEGQPHLKNEHNVYDCFSLQNKGKSGSLHLRRTSLCPLTGGR